MIKLISGKKGTGKTKILIDMMNETAKSTNGNVVCIEKGVKLTYDIKHSIRLVDVEHYNVSGYDAFYGFLAGMLAGNYDIKEIFVDSILKIGGADYEDLGEMLAKIEKLAGSEVTVTFTVSDDKENLPESVTKYID